MKSRIDMYSSEIQLRVRNRNTLCARHRWTKIESTSKKKRREREGECGKKVVNQFGVHLRAIDI